MRFFALSLLFTWANFFLFFTAGLSQNPHNKAVDSTLPAIQDWLLATYIFDKPSEEFVPSKVGNGYFSSAIKAQIKYISLPGTLPEFRKESANEKPSPERQIIDSSLVFKNEKIYWFIVSEEFSPDSNKYENYISIMVASELNGVLLIVTGAYPKSLDARLRRAFIESGMSITRN
ncbi:MAG: hypothetical protein MUE71_08130 [Chitinophagaceae bacterium]|nr:hypothetical protein [Chitinophagaceae bacterium]